MLRNFIDYHIYLFRIRKVETINLGINLVIFILSVIATVREWRDLILNFSLKWSLIGVLVGSFIKFLWDMYGMIGQIKAQLDLRYGELFDEQILDNNLLISDIEKKMGFKIVKNEINSKTEDYVLNSEEIDIYIRESDIKLVESKDMEHKIRDFIQDNRHILLPFIRWQYRISKFYGKGFFNEKKLCLSNNIAVSQDIKCHKGTYYDTFLTNHIAGKKLRSNRDNSIIADASSFLPVEYTKRGLILQDITKSVMNNEIGVSTLGFTSDNYLVMWNQNRLAQSSSGLLVPMGSGSCDWNDVDTVNWSFNTTITNAMQRELWEESGSIILGKHYKAIGDTRLIGFFRWIKKGGKPEFVGITKLNIEYNALKSEKSEVFDGASFHINSIDEIPDIIEKVKDSGNISVPLYMGLFCLDRYFTSHRVELEKFILG